MGKNDTIDENKLNDNNGEDGKPRKKNSVHLKTPEDLRRLLCEVINELRRSEDGTLCNRSSRIIDGAKVLLTIFQQSDFEERLRRLEDKDSYGR